MRDLWIILPGTEWKLGLRGPKKAVCVTCISFICVEIFEFMDAGKSSLEKVTELVSWTQIPPSHHQNSPFFLSGICHTLQYNSIQGVGESWGSVYVGYKNTLEDSDIPGKFRIFFTPKNEWYGVVIGNSIF